MATIKCTVQRSSWYEVYFEYSYTQDKATAKTSLTHSLKLKQLTNSYDFDTVASITVGYKVNGTTYSKTGRINIDDKGNAGYTITLASGSTTITHNASTGVGSFTVSVDTSIDSGGYGPGTIKLTSQSIPLPTIYRASVPTVGASSIKMGGSLSIITNRKSSAFTHTIKYAFGGATDTIKTGVGASCVWNVPDLASKCNNALSGTATITCITYNGSTKIGEETCTVTLTVPGVSTPSFSASGVDMGNSVTVYTNRGSTNFTHTIEFVFAGETVSTKTGVGASTTFVPSLDLAKKIPSDPSGAVTVKCTTYNGTAKVGSTVSKTFTATVPNNSTTKPTASCTFTPTGSLPSAFSGMYVQGKTGVKAAFTASSTYSTIASYKLTADGRNFFGNPATSSAFTREGNFTVTGIVTDARGFSKEIPKDITVIPYSTPTIEPYTGHSSIICERSLQDGTYDDAGTYLHIKCKRKYSPVNGKNTCTIQYQYKMAGGSWSSLKTLLDGTTTSANDYEGVLPDIVSQTDKSYTIRLVVKDAIGSSEPYEFPIATADVTMHLGEGGYGVAFGKYSEATPDDKKVEIDDDWSLVMSGEAVKDFVVEQGTSGNWEYRKWASGKAECWGRFSVDVAINTSWGSLYYGIVSARSLPFTFSSIPICFAFGEGSVSLITSNSGTATTTQTQSIILVRPIKLDTVTTFTIQFVVYGRWR